MDNTKREVPRRTDDTRMLVAATIVGAQGTRGGAQDPPPASVRDASGSRSMNHLEQIDGVGRSTDTILVVPDQGIHPPVYEPARPPLEPQQGSELDKMQHRGARFAR